MARVRVTVIARVVVAVTARVNHKPVGPNRP